MEMPSKEQFLYSQLAVAETLLDYITDNLERTDFDNATLAPVMFNIMESIKEARVKMQTDFQLKKRRKEWQLTYDF